MNSGRTELGFRKEGAGAREKCKRKEEGRNEISENLGRTELWLGRKERGLGRKE